MTINPKTRYALFPDEYKFMGLYESTREAAIALGELFKFCKVINDSPNF